MSLTLEDLKKFCSVDETRPMIMEPFSQGGYTYATDGRILVRVRKIPEVWNSEIPAGAHAVIPAESPKLAPVEFPPGWQDWKPEMEDCEECQGKGHFTACDECDGEGEAECESCGQVTRCEACSGNGTMPSIAGEVCGDCHGSGETEKTTPVALSHGAVFVALPLLRLVRTLPNWRLRYEDDEGALRIDFDGGEGALMPLRFPGDAAAEIVKEQWGERSDGADGSEGVEG